MTSFSGPSSLATDAMRSFYTLLGKRPSPVPRSVPQNPSNRVWQPNHGIVFAGASRSSAPLVLSTASAAIVGQDLAVHSQTEDLYVLTSSFESSTSDQGVPPSNSGGTSDNDDTSWVPSTGSSTLDVVIRSAEEKSNKQLEVVPEVHSNLTFRIPQEVFDQAKKAVPDTPESFWSYKMYHGPNDEKVKVHYCRSKLTMERVLKNYFMNAEILGFDIEWKKEAHRNSGIKKNVSSIQLACEDRIALIHLALFPTGDKKDTADDFVTPSLKKIMESPDVTKAGVSIKADCTRLEKHLQIKAQGIFELSHLYNLVKHSASGNPSDINKKLVSLATQVKEHLGLPLYKGDSVRGSDWSQPVDMDQITYASSDSYAGLALYDSLEAKRKQLDPMPPRPYHAERNLPIRLASGAVIPITDEATEELEPQSDPAARVRTAKPAVPIEASTEDIQIEQDADADNTTTAQGLSKSRAKPQSLIDAESWAASYRISHPVGSTSTSTKPTSFCTPAILRTYALWQHNTSLSIRDIAATLRQPPLQESTVRSYILEAVRIEKLPYDGARLRAVLEELPERARETYRYKALWKSVQ
ncbi:MAG: hypothetical protein M1818_008017 [Claussenomyces sp. TS43310]|nr:MAG: hypothetical protein M1818_008017 [Claussenomyces sp. TS43310]